MDFLAAIRNIFTVEMAIDAGESLLIFVVGYLAARVIARVASGIAGTRGDAQLSQIVGKFAFYTIFAIATLTSLDNLGVELGVLIGAAGILTVAVGFASQTSASNVISGLFLLGERPFVVGNVIEVGGLRGQVLSVDLLSVKLKTFDNIFVRIPNETLIKSEIRNISKFPIRRVDLLLGVAYKEDLQRVHELLADVARREPLCLEQPGPLFLVKGFGSSSVDLQFSVWGEQTSFMALRNSMYMAIKHAFDDAGIEIPFPHVSLYAGSATDPLPLEMTAVESAKQAAD